MPKTYYSICESILQINTKMRSLSIEGSNAKNGENHHIELKQDTNEMKFTRHVIFFSQL